MEDVRLFSVDENGGGQFFCTDLELNPKNVPQTGWGRFDADGKVTSLIPLRVGDGELECEKNWLPFPTDEGKVRFVYSVGPLGIFELDDGKATEVAVRDLVPENVDDFRGSGAPIPYKGGWLATVHQVQYANPRKYFHRFVWFDWDFTRMKYGPPFYFREPNIEYNLSVCDSPEGIILAHSFRDSTTELSIVDHEVVDRMLETRLLAPESVAGPRAPRVPAAPEEAQSARPDEREGSGEELYQKARAARIAGRHVDAYAQATAALARVKPEERWRPFEEVSISAFYLGKKTVGLRACEQVMFSPQAPFRNRNSALDNSRFYIGPLETKRRVKLDCDIPDGFRAANPSVMRTGEGFLANVRAVNYRLSGGAWAIDDPQGISRSRNFLVTLDKSFAPVKKVELTNASPTPLYPRWTVGMEDVRLFGDGTFFCTDLELNPGSVPQMALGTYEPDGRVMRLLPLAVGGLRPEKNWLPFVDEGVLQFIYSFGPLRIFSLDPVDGAITELVNRKFDGWNLEEFRGSGSPIPYRLREGAGGAQVGEADRVSSPDGWLMTVHQVHYVDPPSPRKYLHRFVWLDRGFEKIRFGPPFYFEEPKVEYHLAVAHSDEGLVLAYSVNDASAMLAVVDYQVVDAHLEHFEAG